MYYRLVPFATFAIQVALLVILLRVRRKRPAHHIFAIYLAATAAWSLLIAGMRNSPTPEDAFIWWRIIFLLIPLTSVLLFHFCLLFAGQGYTRKPLVFAYAFGLAGLLISLNPLVLNGTQVRPYGYAPGIGPAGYIWLCSTYLPALWGIACVWRAYRYERLPEKRTRAYYVLMGLILIVVVSCTDLLVSALIPPYRGDMLANTLMNVLLTIAVVRQRLLDVRYYMYSGLSYFFAGGTVILCWLGLFLLADQIFGKMSIIAGAFLALAVYPVLKRLQRGAISTFSGGTVLGKKLVDDLAEEACKTLDSRKLATRLVGALRQALKAHPVHLYIYFAEKGILEAVESTSIVENLPHFPQSSLLVARLMAIDRPLIARDITTDPVLSVMSFSEREALAKLQAEILIPLKNQERLVGLLVLGEKESWETYNNREIENVVSVTRQAAMAIDSALLYEREKKARQELESQQELRMEFADALAHETKTPITAILACSELLAAEVSSESDRLYPLAQNIYGSARNLSRRVAELIDFAKVRRSEIDVSLQPTDIAPLARSVAGQLSLLLTNRGQNIVTELSDTLPQARADPGRVEQIITNLLTNASKFSPEGAAITLRAQQNDDFIQVEVEDTATPITTEEAARLFVPYYRGKLSRNVPGLGLGLYISKKLVELQGGRIWVRNGIKGNIFTFSLPLEKRGPTNMQPHDWSASVDGRP